jgi:hypothetical protein
MRSPAFAVIGALLVLICAPPAPAQFPAAVPANPGQEWSVGNPHGLYWER